MSEALIILGDQLFAPNYYSKYSTHHVFMAEDLELASHYQYHKHKIAFFFLAMRNFADDLKKKSFKVTYEKLSHLSFLDRLTVFIKKNKITKIVIPEIQDKFFETKMIDFFTGGGIKYEIIPSPMFLCSRGDFRNYLARHKKPLMKNFYEEQRKKHKVLLTEEGGPLGDQWSFDSENRKKVPKNLTNKPLLPLNRGPHEAEVFKIIDEEFSAHPGSLENFWAPVTRSDSLLILKHFVVNHLESFGDYQDAMTDRDPFLYHSVISPMLNNGLLTPKEVIQTVEEARKKNPSIPLNSVEGFIRQVLGWREFVRGIYQEFSEQEESTNFFGHKRKLTKDWYLGTTGILPVDDAIKKAVKYGYCHHIERLMVLSNIMLLSEIDPKEVHKWFMEMFIDSADWVMGPNVYGMGQFSDGGIFATKPYISGSNYILKMSDYKKDPVWCDLWDGLYWRFIDKHAAFFSKNHRLNMMVKLSEKMDAKKKQRLMGIAEEFLNKKTN
ncbi:MAG: cryptochrome/photolyase family protein [Bacteriovoracaceae bacterium]|nr:cryptochrome/photolyase family protein [Bacteriovoracaceae bacterium]